jgi:phosphoribosyl 1,2-cyclic phosphodiesterase
MHRPFVAVLSSGSCGNAILFHSKETSVLIDAGISCREIERRLSVFGSEASEIDAVLLTHEHTDHNRGAKRFCSVHGIPAFGTAGTLSLTSLEGVDATPIRRQGAFGVGDLRVRSFPVMHLAAEPVGFSIATDGTRVAVASDLGCLTKGVLKEMRDSNLVMVEANYDESMLLNGGYPDFLKRAIAGDHGHLSNDGAGMLCAEAATERTREIVLLHLSKDNNTIELAKEAVEGHVRNHGGMTPKVTPTEHGARSGPFAL